MVPIRTGSAAPLNGNFPFLLTTEPVEVIGPWEFAAMYQAEEDPAEKQRIGEALEAQGYFSAAVPLSWEYQDYMRTYCHLYGCPYPLALAVADWETRGQFNMDAIGPAGEVGIMQLNPGPDGSYHAELEDATGLDPTTPEEECGTTTVPWTGWTTLARPGALQRLSLALFSASACMRKRSAGSTLRPMRSPHTPSVPGPPARRPCSCWR